MNIKCVSSTSIPAEQWDSFILASPEGMVYALTDFLNGMAPDWSAYIIEDDNKWQMVFPFRVAKKYFLSYFLQPKFTQFLGPAFKPFSGKASKELQWKNKALDLLCKRIKQDFSYVNFNMHPGMDYTIPFVWNKFRVSPRFTYQIQLSDRSLTEIEGEVQKGKIQMHKAIQAGFSFEELESAHDLVDLFARLKSKAIGHLTPKDYSDFAEMLKPLWEKGYAKVFKLSSPDGELAGGMVLYIYKGCLTYAFSVADPKFSKLSIGHALIWKSVQYAKEQGLDLVDFEGSMIPEIERVFRRFGAKPTTYLNVQQARFRFLYR